MFGVKASQIEEIACARVLRHYPLDIFEEQPGMLFTCLGLR